jgi:hypothetical protein
VNRTLDGMTSRLSTSVEYPAGKDSASSRALPAAHFLLTTFTLGQGSYQIKGWGRGIDPATAQ